MVSVKRASASASASASTTATASSTSTSTSTSTATATASESSSSLKLSVFTLFLIFATVHVIGGTINHIDDTDEVYGYYEPLHYLLYGKGMQTWEYSPVYAIRYRIIISLFLLYELIIIYKDICILITIKVNM